MSRDYRAPRGTQDVLPDDQPYWDLVSVMDMGSLPERDVFPGWHDAGPTGTKEDCLAYIERVWTDMRPLSLRKKMAEARKDL